jgi:hypothetical protein
LLPLGGACEVVVELLAGGAVEPADWPVPLAGGLFCDGDDAGGAAVDPVALSCCVWADGAFESAGCWLRD